MAPRAPVLRVFLSLKTLGRCCVCLVALGAAAAERDPRQRGGRREFTGASPPRTGPPGLRARGTEPAACCCCCERSGDPVGGRVAPFVVMQQRWEKDGEGFCRQGVLSVREFSAIAEEPLRE